MEREWMEGKGRMRGPIESERKSERGRREREWIGAGREWIARGRRGAMESMEEREREREREREEEGRI